jgi:hypothetical protein
MFERELFLDVETLVRHHSGSFFPDAISQN